MSETGRPPVLLILHSIVGSFVIATLCACSLNPVTKKQNLQFYDLEWENRVGRENYAALRQAQGGDYVVDQALVSYINNVGQRLAKHARRNDQMDFEFAVINDSSLNAWSLPGGKIAINRGLLSSLETEAQLAAVLGHEIVHVDAAHAARAQSVELVTQIGAVVGMVIIESEVESNFAQSIAVLVPQLGATLITQKHGRDAEREADKFAMQYMLEAGYDPQGAVELQEVFLELSEDSSQDWVSGLFASHPPSDERLENNRKLRATLSIGGETGKHRYQQNLKDLKAAEPAYQAFEAALDAAAEEDYSLAMQLADEALQAIPQEALFYALKGDLLAIEGLWEEAYEQYNQAVSLDPGYYYHLLSRGQAYFETEKYVLAKSDLTNSNDMLETTLAHYLLGQLEMMNGNEEAAKKHFKKAAKSDSD